VVYKGVNRFESCPNCGKKNKYNRKYCSRDCQYTGYVGTKHTDETKLRISKITKEKLQKPETKLKMRNAKLGTKLTQEHKDKIGKASKKLWQDPEYRNKIIEKQIGHTVSTETRELIGQSRRGNKHWTNRMEYPESAKIKLREKRLHQVFPKHDSKIEKKVQKMLDDEHIKYRKHEPIMGQPDIFIEPKLAIFIDGCFWHGCTQCYGEKILDMNIPRKSMIRDQKVNNYLSKNKIRVIRFWEHDVIYNSENILKFIKKIM
jgi:DNA mismatch endonuclease, patch repair protein